MIHNSPSFSFCHFFLVSVVHILTTSAFISNTLVEMRHAPPATLMEGDNSSYPGPTCVHIVNKRKVESRWREERYLWNVVVLAEGLELRIEIVYPVLVSRLCHLGDLADKLEGYI